MSNIRPLPGTKQPTISDLSDRTMGVRPGTFTGKHHTPESKEKNRLAQLSRYSKPTLREKLRRAKLGPLNPNWKGGISLGNYGQGFTNTLKAKIRDRDGHLCQMPACGVSEAKRRHQVHHINFVKTDNRPVNLITLCCKHHHEVHLLLNQARWTDFFQELQYLRGLE